MHGTVVGHGTEDHNGRSYKIRVTRIRCTTHTKRHMKATPISPEDYLRNEMSKANGPQTDDKFNELVDHFAQLHKHKCSDIMEMERKDTRANANTIQPTRHTNLEHSETIRQKGNKIKDTLGHNNINQVDIFISTRPTTHIHIR